MKRSAFIVFVVLPLLLLSCAAFWQSDSARAIQAAKTGEYEAAVRTLEPLVAGGNNDTAAVGALTGVLFAGVLGDWFFPFVYNIGLRGFRDAFVGWLLLGGVVLLDATRSRPTAAPAERAH